MHELYMDMAKRLAQESKAQRSKVGAVLVTNNGVICTGYNGTAAGLDNACEDDKGNTLPSVIHAECNVMAKACREGVSTLGATLYVTLSPCINCAKLIAAAGVKAVYFDTRYRKLDGIDHLRACGGPVGGYHWFTGSSAAFV